MRHLAKNPAGADAVGIFSCSVSTCYSTEAKTDQSVICLLCNLQKNYNESKLKTEFCPCCPKSTSNLNDWRLGFHRFCFIHQFQGQWQRKKEKTESESPGLDCHTSNVGLWWYEPGCVAEFELFEKQQLWI